MNKALLFVAFAAFSTLSYGQTAVSSSFIIGGSVDAETSAGVPTTVSVSNSQGNTINVLGGSFGATNSSEDLVGTGSIGGSLNSTWTSAAAGQVLTTNEWSFDTPYAPAASLNQDFTGQEAWTYTFTATEDSFFCLNWDVVGAGDSFGLQIWYFGFDGNGGGEALGPDAVYPDGNGSLMRDLEAGQTYTVSLTNYGNIFSNDGLILSGSSRGQFDWEIKPVPEPASLGLAGLALLAWTRRRKSA